MLFHDARTLLDGEPRNAALVQRLGGEARYAPPPQPADAATGGSRGGRLPVKVRAGDDGRQVWVPLLGGYMSMEEARQRVCARVTRENGELVGVFFAGICTRKISFAGGQRLMMSVAMGSAGDTMQAKAIGEVVDMFVTEGFDQRRLCELVDALAEGAAEPAA